MNRTILFSSFTWLFFLFSVCLSQASGRHSYIGNMVHGRRSGMKRLIGPFRETLLDESSFSELKQSKSQHQANFSEDSIERFHQPGVEEKTNYRTQSNKGENETLIMQISGSEDLDMPKHMAQGLGHPSDMNQMRSPRSVHYASEYTETAEIGVEDTSNFDILDNQAEEDESIYDESDFDYLDEAIGNENKKRLKMTQTGPPEYMVHLFHMLEGTHIEMLKDTVVTSFPNLYHEAPKEDADGTLKYKLAFRTHFQDESKLPQHTELRVFLELEKPSDNELALQRASLKETCVHIDVLEMILASANDDTLAGYGNSQDGGNHGDTIDKKINNEAITSQEKVDNNDSDRKDRYFETVKIASKDFNISKSGWEGIEMVTDKTSMQTSKQRVFWVHLQQCRVIKDLANKARISKGFVAKRRKGFNVPDDTPQLRIVSDFNSGRDPILIVFSKKKTKVKPKFAKSLGSRLKRDTFTLHGDKTSVSKTSKERFNIREYILRQTTKRSFDFISLDKNIKDRQVNADNGNSGLDFRNKNIELNKKEIINGLNNIKTLRELAKFLDMTSTLSRENEWKSIFKSMNLASIPTHEVIHKVHNLSQGNSDTMLKNVQMEGTLSKILEFKIHRKKGNNLKNVSVEASYPPMKRDINDANVHHPRSRRSARKRRLPCRRVPMYIDFAEIGWGHIFVYPSGYQAYQCKGRCYTPIADYLTPSMHAVVQTRLHTVSRAKASRACCVPTKLSPISVIRTNKLGTYDYVYLYDDMVVKECGCR